MRRKMEKLDVKTPKEALEIYIQELKEDYFKWYKSNKNKNYWFWNILNYVAILTGVLTTAIAALQTSNLNWVKANITFYQTLLIILPIISTSATTLLTQTKSFELYRLREKGRERAQYLIDEGLRKLVSASTDKEYSEIHKFLINEISKLEKDQANNFFKTADH